MTIGLGLALALALMHRPAAPDYGFVRAQEEWVIGTCPPPRRLADGMPPEVAALILQLGDPCYKCRERARTALARRGDDVVPYLFWGLRHRRDASVRLSCWLVLRDLCACKSCGGTGQCPRFRDSGDGWTCLGCGMGEWVHREDRERRCRNCNTRPGLLDMTDLRF